MQLVGIGTRGWLAAVVVSVTALGLVGCGPKLEEGLNVDYQGQYVSFVTECAKRSIDSPLLRDPGLPSAIVAENVIVETTTSSLDIEAHGQTRFLYADFPDETVSWRCRGVLDGEEVRSEISYDIVRRYE